MYSYFLLPIANQHDGSSSSSSLSCTNRGIIHLQEDETTIIGRRNILKAIFKVCNNANCYSHNKNNDDDEIMKKHKKCQTCQELEDWGIKYISKCMIKLHPQKKQEFKTTTTKFRLEQCGLNVTTLLHIKSNQNHNNDSNKSMTNYNNHKFLLSVGDEIHIGHPTLKTTTRKDDADIKTNNSHSFQSRFKFIVQAIETSKMKKLQSRQVQQQKIHNQPSRYANNVDSIQKNNKQQQQQILRIKSISETKSDSTDYALSKSSVPNYPPDRLPSESFKNETNYDSLMNPGHNIMFQQSSQSTEDRTKAPIKISSNTPIGGKSSSSSSSNIQTVNSTRYGEDARNNRNICVFLLALGRNMSRSRICILTDALRRKEIKVAENYENGATHWVIDENMNVEAVASKMGFQSPNGLASYVNQVSV